MFIKYLFIFASLNYLSYQNIKNEKYVFEHKNFYNFDNFNKSKCFNISIILIPGFAASKLDYKYKSNIWKSLWINPIKLVSKLYRSFIKVYYNSKTDTIENYKDVKINVPKWNSTSNVEYLTPSYEFLLNPLSKYYFYIVDQLTKNYCFKRDEDIFAAAYDFRTITENYFDNLTQLVENVFEKTNKKIVLISHSLGGPLTNKFLNSKSFKWKNKYIQGWFSINGVYAPSISALSAVAFGNNFFTNNYQITKIIKYMTENMVSLFSIFPTLKNSKSDTVIARFDKNNITVQETMKFLELNNISYAQQINKLAEQIFECHINDVNLNLLYTKGIPTKNILNITIDKFGQMNENGGYFIDGDGILTLNSLAALKMCSNNQTKSFNQKSNIYNKRIVSNTNVDHLDVLNNPLTIKHLVEFLKQINI